MYCSECGKEVNDGNKFCPYCGFNLNIKTKTADNIKKAANKNENAAGLENTENKNKSVDEIKNVDNEDKNVDNLRNTKNQNKPNTKNSLKGFLNRIKDVKFLDLNGVVDILIAIAVSFAFIIGFFSLLFVVLFFVLGNSQTTEMVSFLSFISKQAGVGGVLELGIYAFFFALGGNFHVSADVGEGFLSGGAGVSMSFSVPIIVIVSFFVSYIILKKLSPMVSDLDKLTLKMKVLRSITCGIFAFIVAFALTIIVSVKMNTGLNGIFDALGGSGIGDIKSGFTMGFSNFSTFFGIGLFFAISYFLTLEIRQSGSLKKWLKNAVGARRNILELMSINILLIFFYLILAFIVFGVFRTIGGEPLYLILIILSPILIILTFFTPLPFIFLFITQLAIFNGQTVVLLPLCLITAFAYLCFALRIKVRNNDIKVFGTFAKKLYIAVFIGYILVSMVMANFSFEIEMRGFIGFLGLGDPNSQMPEIIRDTPSVTILTPIISTLWFLLTVLVSNKLAGKLVRIKLFNRIAYWKNDIPARNFNAETINISNKNNNEFLEKQKDNTADKIESSTNMIVEKKNKKSRKKMSKKKKLLILCSIIAVIILIVGGAITVTALNKTIYSPKPIIEEYVKAFKSGNTKKMTELSGDSFSKFAKESLTKNLLNDKMKRAYNIKVESIDINKNNATANISYRVHDNIGNKIETELTLKKDEKKKFLFLNSWTMDSNLAEWVSFGDEVNDVLPNVEILRTINIDGTELRLENASTVNDRQVLNDGYVYDEAYTASDELGLFLYPGLYDIELSKTASKFFEPISLKNTPVVSGENNNQIFNLKANTTLTSEVFGIIKEKLKPYMNSGELEPIDAPFSYYAYDEDSISNVKWSFKSEPQIELAIGSDISFNAYVKLVVTYVKTTTVTDFLSGKETTERTNESGDTNFNLYGTVNIDKAGKVGVMFEGEDE
ncbi:MAG: zinc-ribbon domain-containing protein, partial [Clostridiales Family XIII bacterium]|nr:zinc-ribbon domain-containing protein [Clostridiales Family XIII bacterium]